LAVSCPGCGAHFHVAGEMAGRKGRCAKCGVVFRVPGPATSGVPQPRKPESVPQYVAVTCRVCQTLMYGRIDQVGQPIKCPDCGAQTIVPPPEKVRPKQPLAAMEGDQYELWGVDEAPSVAEMLSAQPKYIAVVCRMCQTLMHATEDQVGKKLKCPDCGTANVVPPPEAPAKTPSVLTRDEDDLQIDASLDPGERPAVIIPPRRLMLYEEERETERQRQAERRARGDKRGPQFDDKGRPVMPRWPLATRVLPFLFSRGVPVRWLALSVGAFLSLGVMLLALWLAAQGGFGAIGGMCCWAIGLISFIIWFAAFSAIVVTIVTESSEGADEVLRWPGPMMSEWLGELFYMFFACLVSPLPGWLIGRVVVEDPSARGLLFVGSVFVCFPVILLSQLDVGSAFAVASPRVIVSFVRLPGTWLMFYAEIAALVAVCVAVTITAALLPAVLVVLLVPLYVAAILLAARILGRLGWKLAETLPAKD
jgi:DNA-directed RNA polymerase subunit M/transcription elongation factor TFIIS